MELSGGGAVALGTHHDNLKCTWRLVCPSPRQRPLLSFARFGTEKGYDFLTVVDGGSAAEPAVELARLSGYSA